MISLYDISVMNYLRILDSTIALMKKSEAHFNENGQSLSDIMSTKLAPDMFPFPFQVHSVRHHSLHAVQGMLAGEFGPPSSLPTLDYAGLVNVLEEARTELAAISESEVNALEGKLVLFKMGKMEIPFTAENFAQSFTMPNIYFHASTAYNILRMKGAPLGKMDFMGSLKIGMPE